MSFANKLEVERSIALETLNKNISKHLKKFCKECKMDKETSKNFKAWICLIHSKGFYAGVKGLHNVVKGITL
jgi:hypothetical protein